MRTMMLFAVSVAIGFSQEASRTLQFTQLQTARQFAEAATVIRSVGEIRNLTVDASQRTMTLQGDPSQLALADWIFPKLDRPAARPRLKLPSLTTTRHHRPTILCTSSTSRTPHQSNKYRTSRPSSVR